MSNITKIIFLVIASIFLSANIGSAYEIYMNQRTTPEGGASGIRSPHGNYVCVFYQSRRPFTDYCSHDEFIENLKQFYPTKVITNIIMIMLSLFFILFKPALLLNTHFLILVLPVYLVCLLSLLIKFRLVLFKKKVKYD